MFLIYSLLYVLALIFILPFQYLKRPKILRKRWLKEKLGLFELPFQPPHTCFNKRDGGGSIWVHAVSVGEVTASIPLLNNLRMKYPLKNLILSTITDTGQKIAKEKSPEGTAVVYLPFDIALILNSVLKKIKPEILIVIETELWPNLFRVFKKDRIPVILLNGRISEKSFKGYKKISFFMKKVLSYVDFFGMQNEEYTERIRSLGVESSRIMNLGNFKFDARPPLQIPEWTHKIKGQVIVAGSTHEGEEELITSAYIDLKKEFPDLNLIIAPRHPERFKPVEDMLKLKGVLFVKRSAFETPNPPIPPLVKGGKGGFLESQIFKGIIILLDTVGELSAVYGRADITVIGKSFRGYGGQNPLEPAFWGKIMICGPNMENFPVIKDFYKDGAAIEVEEEGLYSKLKELLISPEKAKEIGLKAQELYRRNSGAVDKAIKVIQKYISQ
ncbi:MAG: 3-deoxy-D-manno-octulosonic acid transferase [Nitrospirota bacterium]